MDKNNYAVIMAGGIGSRFWPFSRNDYPKQFHDVLGTGKTMLQETADRLDGLIDKENILVVTSYAYKDLVMRDLPWLNKDHLLLEPVRRNTAPCIAYAAYKLSAKNPNARMVVCPSDHVITQPDQFRNTLSLGLDHVKTENRLITLGIKPHRPDTGYGYIQYHDVEGSQIKKVKTFTEKPELDLARKFLESGDFVWNAGIFIWNVQTIIESFRLHLTYLADIFENGVRTFYGTLERNFIENAYAQSKNISIDYGILEKADNVYVIPSQFGWSDLGTWKSLYELSSKDENQNVTTGNVILYDSENCIVKTSSDRLIVVNGLQGYIVADQDGVVMICPLEDEQKVKDFVNDLKASKNSKYV